MRRFPRTPPRLERIVPNNPVYFVTACTYRRKSLLANDPVATAFAEFTERAYSERNIAVGRYVIMPDHIHLFVCGPDDFELGRWMGMLKQCLAKNVVRAPSDDPVWQRRFFDHVLRSDESYAEKWNYVRENPVRAELVTNADDWPYAGEIITIDRA
ncbi:MAG TPA: transposase [Chthoniobacterales bacterium]|nr:transposase [Chthoniobacterales bacterium]